MGIGAGVEEFAHTKSAQLIYVFIRDDASACQQHIIQFLLFHQGDQFREYRIMGTGKNADPNGIHIFLESGIDHHFGGLPKPGIDHFHPCIPQGGCNDFSAAVMPVESDFGDQNSDRSVHLANIQDTKLGSFLHYPVNYGMQYRKFGTTGLRVSEVGFGAWAIGGAAMIGNTAIGWGDADDTVSAEAIRASLDAGINFFDTADIYGLGHSEELLGRLIGDRKDVIIASKVGNVSRDGQFTIDYTKEYILRACEQSLRRLRKDTIDYYQLHTARLEHLQQGDCITAMQELQKAGKIRYWGLSLNTFDPLPEAEYLLNQGLGNGFQLVLNLLNQRSLPLLKAAVEKGYGIIARMPLQFGLLTGKFDKGISFPENDHRHNRLLPAIVDAVAKALGPVWELCEKYQCSKTQLALSYLLSYPEVSVIIPGIRTPEQMAGNTSGLFQLEETDLRMIESLGKTVFVPLMEQIKQQG